MANWYENRYRRHLLDMHINDWSDEFLSRFDINEYVKNLETAHINMPMIYLQSHAGLCYYPTKTARMHRAFEKETDKMRRLIGLCHEKGMKVVGYYSLIFNRWAEDNHPDWRMLQPDGQSRLEKGLSRHGLCCPNNMDYRAFVFAQIKEMIDYFDVDGLFYDMPFWPHQCYCPCCQARWAKEEGGELPLDKSDTRWERMLTKRREWMGEFAQAVTDCNKALRPDLAVELNFANAIAGGAESAISDGVNEASDYTGGDLTGGLMCEAFTCRYYYAVTKNQPFEYMTPRCPNLLKHTVSLTQRELDAAVMLTAAHHGASLIIDAIDPVGTMDERVYRHVGAALKKQMPYERYFTGRPVCDVGVFYHLPSKVRRRNQTFSNFDGALGAVRTLMGAHVPVGVATYRQWNSLSQYPVLCLPYMHSLTEEERALIVRYVEDGGKLYLSGAEDAALVEALLGAKVEGLTAHTQTYIAPVSGCEALFCDFNEDYPLPAEESVPVLKDLPKDAQVLARVKLPYTLQGTKDFASIHSNPPGVMTDMPAAVLRKKGKGAVLWMGAPIERESLSVYGDVFMNLLGLLGLQPRVTSTASKIVELVPFEDEGSVRVSAVRLNSDFEGKLPPFEISVWCAERPKDVLLLPDRTPVPFEYADGAAKFEVRALDLFDMYEIVL